MRKKLRDLDLAHVVARVMNATDATRRIAADVILGQNIAKTRDPARAVRQVRNHIAQAILDTIAQPADVRDDDPLVRAFIRAQHHPAAAELPAFRTDAGVDLSPRFKQLTDAHPELVWDPSAVQADLFASIKAHGDHELDDTPPPWLMAWGPATAAKPLLWFATLMKFGDLPGAEPGAPAQPDEHEKGTAEEERRHYEETKHIKPSPLVAPPPPKPPR